MGLQEKAGMKLMKRQEGRLAFNYGGGLGGGGGGGRDLSSKQFPPPALLSSPALLKLSGVANCRTGPPAFGSPKTTSSNRDEGGAQNHSSHFPRPKLSPLLLLLRAKPLCA